MDNPMSIGSWYDEDDYERDTLRMELAAEFRYFIQQQRRAAQEAVRALYPRLYEGVDAHKIQQACEDALYWLNIPDAWAERYADEYADNWEVFETLPGGVQWWIDNELDLERLKAEREEVDS